MPGEWIGPYPVEDMSGWGGFANVYRTGLADVSPALAGVAGWVDAVLGGVEATDDRMLAFFSGSGSSAVPSPPGWFDDQVAAASQLRAVMAGRTARD